MLESIAQLIPLLQQQQAHGPLQRETLTGIGETMSQPDRGDPFGTLERLMSILQPEFRDPSQDWERKNMLKNLALLGAGILSSDDMASGLGQGAAMFTQANQRDLENRTQTEDLREREDALSRYRAGSLATGRYGFEGEPSLEDTLFQAMLAQYPEHREAIIATGGDLVALRALNRKINSMNPEFQRPKYTKVTGDDGIGVLEIGPDGAGSVTDVPGTENYGRPENVGPNITSVTPGGVIQRHGLGEGIPEENVSPGTAMKPEETFVQRTGGLNNYITALSTMVSDEYLEDLRMEASAYGWTDNELVIKIVRDLAGNPQMQLPEIIEWLETQFNDTGVPGW